MELGRLRRNASERASDPAGPRLREDERTWDSRGQQGTTLATQAAIKMQGRDAVYGSPTQAAIDVQGRDRRIVAQRPVGWAAGPRTTDGRYIVADTIPKPADSSITSVKPAQSRPEALDWRSYTVPRTTDGRYIVGDTTPKPADSSITSVKPAQSRPEAPDWRRKAIANVKSQLASLEPPPS